jgi:hypothetical protein
VFVRAPSFVIGLALFFLVSFVFWKFLIKGDFSSVLPIYLVIIALSVALASMTFTYSRTTEDDEEAKKLVSIGKFFITTALLLIFALLITWVGSEVQTLLKNGSHFETFEYPLVFIIGLGNGILITAARYFHAGITNLQKHVSPRGRGRPLDSTHKEKPSTILHKHS